MTRDATTVGLRTEAVASAGTLYRLAKLSVTFILSPAGSTLSTLPTFTPMIWTRSPGYTANASAK